MLRTKHETRQQENHWKNDRTNNQKQRNVKNVDKDQRITTSDTRETQEKGWKNKQKVEEITFKYI
jgi:hypothetical protein